MLYTDSANLYLSLTFIFNTHCNVNTRRTVIASQFAN